MLESQSDFARRLGVSKQAVNGYLKHGQIKGAALVPKGKRVLIDVDVATEQLRGNLDPYQRMANGRAEIGKRTAAKVLPEPEPEGEPLSDDAAQLWGILSEVPSDAAWEVAAPGGTTQRAFDVFMAMRMNLTAFLRMRQFELPNGVESFEPVDWPGLAEEMGLTLIDPAAMLADWNRRRLADD